MTPPRNPFTPTFSGPLNARLVCKRALLLPAEERPLAWFIHSLSQTDKLPAAAGAIAKMLQGQDRPALRSEANAEALDVLLSIDEERPRRKLGRPYSADWIEQKLRQWCSEAGPRDDEGSKLPVELHRALLEFSRSKSAEAVGSFYQTNIGRTIWQTLDWCLETRQSACIWGEAGRGKTAALRAWCDAHRSEARFFTVPGYGTQRDFYNAVANGFGLPHSSSKTPSQTRGAIAEVAQHSRLMTVIDESHFILRHQDGDGSPPLLDWIDAALVDKGVAVALVGTPQFASHLAQIERKTGYNADQFRHRFAGRWVTLPAATAEKDLVALAVRHLPGVGKRGQNEAANHGSGRFDVSGLFHLVREAREIARRAGHDEPDEKDLQSALTVRMVNDGAMVTDFAATAKRAGASRRQMAYEPPAPGAQPPGRGVAPISVPMKSAALAARSRPVLAEVAEVAEVAV